MPNPKQPDTIGGQLKNLGRTLGILSNKATGEAYKLGAWRLFKLGGLQVMNITTVGRKSGRQFTTPIGYARDGQYIYAATVRDRGPISNWFRNIQANGKVWVQLEDKRYQGSGEAFEDAEHVTEILKIWARVYPAYFRFFGVNLNGRKTLTDAEIAATAKKVVVVRIKTS